MYRPESRRAVAEVVYMAGLVIEATIDLVKLYYSLRRLVENFYSVTQYLLFSLHQSPKDKGR